MKTVVFFFAFSFYMAVSNIDPRPVERAPIVYVMQRKRLDLPRRKCANLSRIRIAD